MMRRRGIRKSISLLLVCILVAGSMSVLPARAGSSSVVVDNTSFEKELDVSLWNSPNSDVAVQNGTLVFSNDSTDSTSLITRTNARISEYHDELVRAEVTMQFTKLPQEEAFVLAFGLASVEAMMEEAGNVEIHFTNDGGLKVSVTAYDDAGDAVTVAEPVSCGSVNSAVKVSASISTEGVLALSVNGKQICNTALPCSGEGRVGFLQTGSCGAVVSDVRIACYEYDRPENCNVYEDFEQEAMNTNTLTAKMVYASPSYAPSGMLIEEIDGNHVLRFKNSGPSYVGSVYQYSNFEMTFDVVYLQRTAELDEEGGILVPKSDNFAVSFGDEAADYKSYGYLTSTDMLIFESGSSVRSMNTDNTAYMTEKGYPYYAADCDKNFSIKVSVIDAVVSVGIKWIEEENFTEIMSYQLSGKTPLGYVHIWTTALTANFAIDNLSIVNKDKDAKTIEVDYKSSLITAPADYEYTPMEYVKSDEVKEEEGFNLYLVIPIVAALCAATLGIAVAVKKKKGGAPENA